MYLLTKQAKKPDRREYTFMLVPHHGQAGVRSIHVPILAIKCLAAALCLLVVVVIGGVVSYRHTAVTAGMEKAELEKLKQVNGSQVKQIEDLAKSTAALEQDMERLNTLDAEIRHIVNENDNGSTSRAGVTRMTPGSAQYTGQGGPNPPSLEEMGQTLEDLKKNMAVREQSLVALKEELLAKQARAAVTPSIWPASGQVTSRFGYRSSPWGRGSDYHPGIDIASDYGTPIVATADGTVVHSDWSSGYGKLVEVDHGNGIVTLYGHCSQLLVKSGDYVKKGQVVAYMGSTGLSTGTHVHYEVRVNGTAVNPDKFL
ncbi:M23 family metallopeptidase [Propionispora hippei]|uniref:M23 family metallopeptidase n=1 Tax=Propionispora hippei TaxID=209080 RepID=UPI001CB73A50|nr:M23 family metallopeptidase [Propionispora hippei]